MGLMTPKGRPLTRSEDRWLGGVCGGLAYYLGWPPLLVRVLWVIATLLTMFAVGIVGYLFLWAFMPAPGHTW